MGSLPMDRTRKLAIDEQAELWFGLLCRNHNEAGGAVAPGCTAKNSASYS